MSNALLSAGHVAKIAKLMHMLKTVACLKEKIDRGYAMRICAGMEQWRIMETADETSHNPGATAGNQKGVNGAGPSSKAEDAGGYRV
jgi:hypothetical protein